MIVLDPNINSPWYPLVVAEVLAHGNDPGNYPPQITHWLTWHFHFRLHGHGFIPCTREMADSLLGIPPSRAEAA